MTKLKIFNGATPAVGETISGFVIDPNKSPFSDGCFITTAPIDALTTDDAGEVVEIAADKNTYELERVEKPVWMVLMAGLERYRDSSRGA